MGPDPTQASFWPTVNKGPTQLWPDQGRFFWPRKKLAFFEEIFLTQGRLPEMWNFFGQNPSLILLQVEFDLFHKHLREHWSLWLFAREKRLGWGRGLGRCRCDSCTPGIHSLPVVAVLTGFVRLQAALLLLRPALSTQSTLLPRKYFINSDILS